MTTVHTLASGSSGNALVLSCGDTHLLVDAGISCRRITVSLRELGLTPEDLDAVFITHTHSDHIAGLQTLLKRTAFPVYGSAATCRGLVYRLAGIEDRLRPMDFGQPLLLGAGKNGTVDKALQHFGQHSDDVYSHNGFLFVCKGKQNNP